VRSFVITLNTVIKLKKHGKTVGYLYFIVIERKKG